MRLVFMLCLVALSACGRAAAPVASSAPVDTADAPADVTPVDAPVAVSETVDPADAVSPADAASAVTAG